MDPLYQPFDFRNLRLRIQILSAGQCAILSGGRASSGLLSAVSLTNCEGQRTVWNDERWLPVAMGQLSIGWRIFGGYRTHERPLYMKAPPRKSVVTSIPYDRPKLIAERVPTPEVCPVILKSPGPSQRIHGQLEWR
jgi:hypothetical protein